MVLFINEWVKKDTKNKKRIPYLSVDVAKHLARSTQFEDNLLLLEDAARLMTQPHNLQTHTKRSNIHNFLSAYTHTRIDTD